MRKKRIQRFLVERIKSSASHIEISGDEILDKVKKEGPSKFFMAYKKENNS